MNIEDVFELVDDGKNTEAQALMRTLSENAKSQPDEIKQEAGCAVVFKRRGKIVAVDKKSSSDSFVQDEDGNWKLKNPPQRKTGSRSKL